MVGTNLNANEKEKAYSYGIFILIRDRAKSFGSTVKKNNENADIIIEILKIIATEKDNPFSSIKSVLRTRIKMKRKDIPFMLFTHFLKSLPKIMIGSRVIKISNKGTIS
jgi:hypothetical protein